MHYYKRNLGDYAKKAGRLSMLQHGAYTLLIDACYDREQFPTKQEAIEWTWASSSAEIEAVEFVLSRFFVKRGDVFVDDSIRIAIEEWNQRGWIPRDPRLNYTRPASEEWMQIRARIFERDNYTCNYCGKRGGRLECDHIVPVSRGGCHDNSNLTTACFRCNREKGAKTLAEWRAKA